MQGTLDEQLRSIGLSAAEIVSFKELLNAAVAHRRAQWEKLSPADQEYWVLDMAELVHECGISRVYAGMRKAWTWNKFLASAAEVRECLPPVPNVAKPRAVHDPHCADCSGSGWKHGPVDEHGGRRVARCDCNLRPHKPCTVVANAETAAWIKQKLAELDAAPLCWSGKGKMGLSVPRKRYEAAPIIPTTAELAAQLGLAPVPIDQIQQRKPMERAECQRVEQHLEAQRNGQYEKQA